MYDLTTDTNAIDWSPTGWAGVTMKLLSRGDTGGGVTGIMRLSPGSTVPAHRHSQADQSVYVLEGDLIDEGGVTYGPGTLIVAKANTPHGPHATKNGCVLLSVYHGTPDFVVVE